MIPLAEIEAELARRSFAEFVDLVSPQLKRAQFHDCLDEALNEFAHVGGFMVIVAPPQHGKSERVSRHLPAYLYALDPTCNIMGISYGQELANRMSRDTRRIMSKPKYRQLFPETRVGAAADAKHAKIKSSDKISGWETTEGGEYRAAGMTAGATGMPANWLIVDDPLKNREEAQSPTRRQKVWDEFSSTFRSRLKKSALGNMGVLVTLTRWHEDDLAGRLIELMGGDSSADQYQVFRFPAFAEPDAEDRHPGDTREKDEPLWADEFPAEELNARRAISERDFVSLYLGRPTAEGGNMVKAHWPGYWHEPVAAAYAPAPHIVIGPNGEDFACAQVPYRARDAVGVAISCDATFKNAPGTDFVGLGLWARTADGRHFRINSANARMDYIELKATLRAWILEYNPGVVLIEDAANGPAVIAELRLEFGNDRIIPRPTAGGKVARMNAVLPMFETGRVFVQHPTQSIWCREYMDQLTKFPNVAHDDLCDETSHYLYWAMEEFGSMHWLELMTKKTS